LVNVLRLSRSWLPSAADWAPTLLCNTLPATAQTAKKRITVKRARLERGVMGGKNLRKTVRQEPGKGLKRAALSVKYSTGLLDGCGGKWLARGAAWG
jgi:hypothetical protein